ncbi:MAG: hypothetical protein EOM66_00270 [Clostridia bacterium]|nr:hypothetical protein [Clostridia bacterium]
MFQSSKKWEETMVTYYWPENLSYLRRDERAEHFVSTVRNILKNHCTMVSRYKPREYREYLFTVRDILKSYYKKLLRGMSRKEYDHLLLAPCQNNGHTYFETLGYIDGDLFFLNSDVLFDKVQGWSTDDEVCINAPKSIYFTDLLRAKVLTPSKRFWNRAEFRLKAWGKSRKFVCVSQSILDISTSEIPSI